MFEISTIPSAIGPKRVHSLQPLARLVSAHPADIVSRDLWTTWAEHRHIRFSDERIFSGTVYLGGSV